VISTAFGIHLASEPYSIELNSAFARVHRPADALFSVFIRSESLNPGMNQNAERLLDGQLEPVILPDIGRDEFGDLELLNIGLYDGMSLEDEFFEQGIFSPSRLSDHRFDEGVDGSEVLAPCKSWRKRGCRGKR
jgi:hypothetical protein